MMQIRNKGCVFSLLISFVLTLASGLILTVCDSSVVYGQEGFDNSGESAYVLGPENLVSIKIFGEAGINPTYRIDQLGYITHALVGRVKLAGLSVAEAEKTMERKLAGDYIINPQVTVFVIEHSRFSILGEVRNPGTYEIMGRVSIIEALSMAGGFTNVANKRDVKILRQDDFGEKTIRVDASNIMDRGEREGDLYVQANDVIIVPKSFF